MGKMNTGAAGNSPPLFCVCDLTAPDCIYCNSKSRREEKGLYRNPWRGVGLCALMLGVAIFIVAIFPVSALMFFVAFLLIFCGLGCIRRN